LISPRWYQITRYRSIGVAVVLAYLLIALFAILLAALLLFLLTYMVEAVDMRLPDLREEIAQCGHRGMHDACMARYVDLVARR
jgi:hypothetical protein